MPSSVQIHRLTNGIRLATIPMPHMASVAMGIWAAAGSRHETETEHGMAHFVEHMLFKGTPTRSAEVISRHVERLGASIDGFTVEDHTGYQIKGPAEKFTPLFEILSDLYSHPCFDPVEIDAERQVILEEIAMIRDQPSQFLDDLISEATWGSAHPLGRTITGTEESLEHLNRASITAFHNRAYTGQHTVVAVAGNIRPEEVLETVESLLGQLPSGQPLDFQAAGPPHHQHHFHQDDNQEQAQLALSFRSVDRHHPSRHSHKLLSIILGENMSSRLFQTLREQLGLCYEVQSDLISFTDAGALQIYLALSPENLTKALDAISRILENLRQKGVKKIELEEAKSYSIGQNRISLESTTSQMIWAGESLLYFDDWIDPEETHARFAGVTLDEVGEAANVAFDPESLCTAVIGASEARTRLAKWLAKIDG